MPTKQWLVSKSAPPSWLFQCDTTTSRRPKEAKKSSPGFQCGSSPTLKISYTGSERTPEAMAAALANTRRLHDKIVGSLPSYTEYEYDGDGGGTLLVAFDHSAEAAREALELLRSRGRAVSLLVPRTLFPVPGDYLRICARHDRVVVVEENLDGQYRKILFGAAGRAGVSGVNAIGRMIGPGEIAAEVER